MRTTFGFMVKYFLNEAWASAIDVKEQRCDVRLEIRLAITEQAQNEFLEFNVV